MSTRRHWLEFGGFATVLGLLVVGFFHDSILGGMVLSPADVLFVEASFREVKGPDYEPMNRLLMDPVLQFQPWLEFNRQELRAGRLPLWNPYVGCGAPHLANGQSAVFDPFHAIAYFGTLPDAQTWMAAARLWIAGLGMFGLARHWKLKRWGRWFAGLVYPFSGFLVVWLLYPVTSVAVWFPWLLWTSDRLLDKPSLRHVGAMAFVVGFCLLGGHVQTSSHILIASGLNLVWRLLTLRWQAIAAWIIAMGLGIGIAAIEVLPMADYLTKSPVWTDRAADRQPPWVLVRPRLLDPVCTALPYAFGSQRRGHPNLAKVVGVHNLNESAGGFAGLATVGWLAPLGLVAGWRNSRVRWLAALTGFAMLAAFRWFPADNLLRAIPVLNVTDNRRLTLWIAFGLSLLGGFGLDRLGAIRRGRLWAIGTVVGFGLALVCAGLAAGIGRFEAPIRAKAIAHYDRAYRETPGADAMVFRARAERQTRDTIRFVRRYYGLAALHLAGLGTMLALVRHRRILPTVACAGLLGLTIVDLFGFGVGLNPAIDRLEDRPVPPLIEHLRKVAPPPGRILGLGEELPPNVCMRYGLADIRNYDSIELASSLDFFTPLYPPQRGERTSRRTLTWAGVLRAREQLREAGVKAIVAAEPPPLGAFSVVEKVGSVWVVEPDARPFAEAAPHPLTANRLAPGHLQIQRNLDETPSVANDFTIHETWDEGWSVARTPGSGESPFLRGNPIMSSAIIDLRYRPRFVVIAEILSVFSGLLAVFALTRFGLLPSTRYVL